MALNATQQWWIRAGGNVLNGGGFDAAIANAGTNYCDQDAPAFSGTNLTVHASDTTKWIPDGHTPAAADVGNIVRVSAGTGWTPGYALITAQDGTYWTMQFTGSALAAVGVATGVWRMGGAFASIGSLASAGFLGLSSPTIATPLAAGHVVNIRGSGSDDPSLADWDHSAGYYTWPSGSAAAGRILFVGYNGRPCFKHCGILFYLSLMIYQAFRNLKFIQGASTYVTFGPISYANNSVALVAVDNVVFDQAGYDATQLSLSGMARNCEFRNSGGASAGTNAALIIGVFKSYVIECAFHGCRGPAIDCGLYGGSVLDSIVFGGKSTTGEILIGGSQQSDCFVSGNTIDSCAGDGVRLTTALAVLSTQIRDNVFSNLTGSGKFAINCTVGSQALNDRLSAGLRDYNCFYNNTANLNALSAGPNDTISTDPQYGGGTNYGIGGNLKAKSQRTLRGTATVDYRDPGAAQRQEPTGGSGGETSHVCVG